MGDLCQEVEEGEQNFKKNLPENELISWLVFLITMGAVPISALGNV